MIQMMPKNRRFGDIENRSKGDVVNEIMMRGRRALDREYEHDKIHLQHELQVQQIELEEQNRELREAQQLLEESRDRYANLFDFAPVGYLTLDETGNILEINLTGAAMLGLERANIVGKPFVTRLANGDSFAFMHHLHKVFQSPGCNTVTELRILNHGAEPSYVRLESATMIHETRSCRTVMTNITEQKRSAMALQQIRTEQETLLNAIPAIVYYKDQDLRYVSISQCLADFLGHPIADVFGKTDYDLFPREVAEGIERHSRAVLETGKAATGIESKLTDAEGHTVYLSSVLAPFCNTQGKICGLVGVGIDITPLKDAANLNRELLLENRALTQNLFNALEKERRHLSRELHDELGQWLTAVQAEAEAIGNSVDRNSAVHAGAEAISNSACQMHEVIRGLLHQLRPAMLDALGLAESLRELTTQWCSRHPDTVCDISLEGDINNLSENINITVYRVVQEALNNICSHAQASHVSVWLSREQGETPDADALLLGVEDNGQGCDPGQKSKGLGLLGMRERTIAAGGEFTLNSTPGHGVHINIRLPLKPHQERRKF